jgi:hypothetical protein
MNDTKPLHLLLGVRAEQSLRDAVRNAIELSTDEAEDLVLAPAGRKDWIAGIRIGEGMSFGELAALAKRVLARLIALESRQRIRAENVRLWVVPAPVPVFRDPLPQESAPAPGSSGDAPMLGPDAEDGETMPCPICGRRVHRFNIQRDTHGRAVGCYQCGGRRDADWMGPDPVR